MTPEGAIYLRARGLTVGDRVKVDGKKDFIVNRSLGNDEFELVPAPTLAQKVKNFFRPNKPRVRKTKDGREYHPTKGFRK